ncbi:hypothetical protein B566_EDAN006129 [Ephemera danica]|nr:hypothetical protein B566_EDAN006129 [Ephemera danica]
MASLLRSCKFVRYFAGFARNFALGTGRQDAFEPPAFNSNPNLYTGLAIRALATQTANVRHDNSLERSIRRLDQDARRAGRISRRELDEVLEEIKQTRSATSSQSLMVIRCCGSLVPEELPENEHQFSPNDFLAELERKGVEPNRVTYQRLVARHCQQGDMEGAARILQIMRDQQQPVNENVFNSLVMGHAQAGDMESARGILGVMKQAGLEPGPDTYTALLAGHAKLGDMEAIRAILAECEAQQVELLDRDLLSVLHSLATAGHTEHVPELMGHLKRQPGYNQDCVNLILRLVNAGQEDVGLQLLGTLSPITRTNADSQQEQIPTGAFFVKQLVKANRPVETIVRICKHMRDSGLHSRALLVAMEASLVANNVATSMALANALKTEGLPLRQHYFWPLLACHTKNKNSQGLCDVLRDMQTLGVLPLRDTLREYVVPGLPGNPENKVSQLRAAGISSGSAACSVALNLLADNSLKDAADIMTQYKATYGFQLFRKAVTQAFVVNPDVPTLIRVLQALLSSPRAPATEETEEETEESAPVGQDPSEMTGRLVLDCFKALRTNKVATLQAILEGLVESGLGISASIAEQLQENLGAELTPELSNLLSKLTSGTLIPQIPVSDEQTQSPNVDGRDLESLLKTLEAKGLPTRNVRRQLLQHYCRTRNLEKAVETQKILESEGFVFPPITTALIMDLYCHHEKLDEAVASYKLLRERDPEFQLDSFKTLRFATLLINNNKLEEGEALLKALPPRETNQEQADRNSFALRAQAWRLLNSLAEQGRADDLQRVFEALVGGGHFPVTNGLVESGLGISASIAEQLQENLGAELTPELSNLLSKLTSGTLIPQIPVSDEQTQSPNVDGRDLESLLKTLEAKGLPTRNVRRQLLQHYCRTRNLEKAVETQKILESEGFVFPPITTALIMDLYCHHEKLDEAVASYKLLRERDPEFQLDSFKTLRFATLLINNNKLEEGEALLKALPPRETNQEQADRNSFALRAQAWRLLNSLAEQGRADDLQRVFEALVGGGHFPVTNNELACRLIQAEDPAALQKITDLSTQVHGEVNSLYDLVLAFVECGRVRQARRILETPGLRSRPFRLSAACQRYSEEGQVASLEGLVEATKDMNHIDRANIYLHLLNTYCKTGDADKALGLWTQAQEEDVQPSDEFLIKLGALLQQQGKQVPFTIPKVEQAPEEAVKVKPSSRHVKPLKPSPAAIDSSSEHALLRQAVRVKDLDKALDMKRIMEGQGKLLSVRDSSMLVESLAAENRIGEASKVVNEMLSRSIYPLPRVFRFVLNKLALAGDVDAIANIGTKLDDEKKKLVSFDNRMCNAHIVAGKAKEYLAGIGKSLDAATTPEEIARFSGSFPRGGAIVASLAQKFAAKGDTAPINVLWMHFFVTGRSNEAGELWNKYLTQTPRLMFQWVCQTARRTESPVLAADLFAVLASSESATSGARGNALSCLLDVLSSQQRYEEALAALTAAQKDVGLDYVNRTALQRLKTGLEEQGKTFPFTIPSKSASKASSSSSSDDEEQRH